jgi:hypothetical protein
MTRHFLIERTLGEGMQEFLYKKVTFATNEIDPNL